MASPHNIATASGRNIAISAVNAVSATNSPLEVMLDRKSGPRPGRGAEAFTANATTTGTAANTARPA
ncbi:MAG: hypothetical protein BWY91_01674 [bacterium ADurb.BinA028]|nr:MAG: hypothetical protein BWY91_01674 [bacterium ADurb.BinA028]